MAVALRLSNDKTLVPVRLAAGESVRESATVHAASGYLKHVPFLDLATQQVLEQRRGMAVSGVVRGGRISWALGRGVGIGE